MLSAQDYLDIMTDTVENAAIGYWAKVKAIKRNKDTYVYSFILTTEECNSYIIDTGVIAKGIKAVQEPDFKIGKWVLDQILTKDFDVITDDVIIQAAIFGEIVYG